MYVLQHTLMPAVTVEAGFVTNTQDNAQFDMTFDAPIAALADGLEAQFGEDMVSVPAYFAGGGIVRAAGTYRGFLLDMVS